MSFTRSAPAKSAASATLLLYVSIDTGRLKFFFTDSFSDGGKWNDYDRAMSHVEEMQKSGCDILDIGGESTRPGHHQISEAEEIARVTPLVESVKKNSHNISMIFRIKFSVSYLHALSFPSHCLPDNVMIFLFFAPIT